VFIVSISLLRKILNACQIEIHGIVAYTFLNVYEKIRQFLSSIKMMHKKEYWFLFFCLGVYTGYKRRPMQGFVRGGTMRSHVKLLWPLIISAACVAYLLSVAIADEDDS